MTRLLTLDWSRPGRRGRGQPGAALAAYHDGQKAAAAAVGRAAAALAAAVTAPGGSHVSRPQPGRKLGRRALRRSPGGLGRRATGMSHESAGHPGGGPAPGAAAAAHWQLPPGPGRRRDSATVTSIGPPPAGPGHGASHSHWQSQAESRRRPCPGARRRAAMPPLLPPAGCAASNLKYVQELVFEGHQ